jgi:putative transposase
MEPLLKAIKVRLYLSQEQKSYVANLLGSCRFVYNKCLEYRIKEYTENKKSVSFGELGKYVTELKKKEEAKWLADVHSKVLQQALMNLDSAYKSFFKNGAGFPKFKSKKNSKESCRFPVDAIGDIKGNRINIIKQLKDIHFKCSRRDEKHLNQYKEKIKSATLSKNKSGEVYLSILIEVPRKEIRVIEKNQKAVGLDVGIKSFIIDSNGKEYENIKIIRNNEKKLKKLQRQISKKKLGSNNRNKARVKLAKFHEKLKNKKEFYLHRVVNDIIKDNQLICIEDLNVKGMMQNHNLAKSIGELSLSRFKAILGYKCDWYGRDLIEIDRFFPSSKKCSCCGEKNGNLTLSVREWKCVKCGTNHNRDHNAAINILNEGKRLFNIGLSSPEFTLGEISTEKSVNQEKNVGHGEKFL